MKHVVRKCSDGRTASTFGTGQLVCALPDGRLMRYVTMRDLSIMYQKRALVEAAKKAGKHDAAEKEENAGVVVE